MGAGAAPVKGLDRPRREIIPGMSEHVKATWSAGISLAAAGLVFLVLRLLAVARYDWDTAFAISDAVDFNGAVSVVVGTVLGATELTAYVLALVLPLMVVSHTRHYHEGSRSPGRLLVLVAFGAVLTGAVLTFRLWGAVLLFATWLVVLFAIGVHGGEPRRIAARLVARIGAFGMAALLVLSAFSDTVWLPREQIVVKGRPPLLAYVMEDTGQSLKVLTDADRKVLFFQAAQVISRADAP